eukprot:1745211-Rhodomonas_salina.1
MSSTVVWHDVSAICLRACYAGSPEKGTVPSLPSMRCPVLKYASVLRTRYEVSGTDRVLRMQ